MNKQRKKIFCAGIMQGGRSQGIESQGYREQIITIIETYMAGPEIVSAGTDPADGADNSREVFFDLIAQAGSSDLFIAYLPSASMGTAVEMYAAYTNGVPITVISSLHKNWTVQYLSTHLFADIDSFEEHLSQGGSLGHT